MSRSDEIRKIVCKLGATWSEYPADVSAMLKEKYQQGDDECHFTMVVDDVDPRYTKQKYVMDFAKLTQKNAYSGRSREIKLIREGEVVEGEDKMTVMKGRLQGDSSLASFSLLLPSREATPASVPIETSDDVPTDNLSVSLGSDITITRPSDPNSPVNAAADLLFIEGDQSPARSTVASDELNSDELNSVHASDLKTVEVTVESLKKSLKKRRSRKVSEALKMLNESSMTITSEASRKSRKMLNDSSMTIASEASRKSRKMLNESSMTIKSEASRKSPKMLNESSKTIASEASRKSPKMLNESSKAITSEASIKSRKMLKTITSESSKTVDGDAIKKSFSQKRIKKNKNFSDTVQSVESTVLDGKKYEASVTRYQQSLNSDRTAEEEYLSNEQEHSRSKKEGEHKYQVTKAQTIEKQDFAVKQLRNHTFTKESSLLLAARIAADKKLREREELERMISEREQTGRRHIQRFEWMMKNRRAPKYKLIYESSYRSEALRLFMLYNDQPFEEEYKPKMFVQDASMGGGCIVVDLEEDYVSRNPLSMLRYLGTRLGMYPSSLAACAEVDEIIGGLREFRMAHSRCSDASKLDCLTAEHMMNLELIIEKNTTGPALFEEGLTIADFELVSVTKYVLAHGITDKDMFFEAFPNIMRLTQRICKNERIEFYDMHERPVGKPS